MPEITKEEVTDWKIALLTGFRKGVTNEVVDLEGEIVKGRSLSIYEVDLGISPEILSGERVLNFGAGNSDLGKELREMGVNCQVVDLDLRAEGNGRDSFIRGDGRTLPFPDQAFDHVLGLWSTYQIPAVAKERVYSELIRVGKTLHMAPIFGDDYRILAGLADDKGYDVVACQQMPKPGSLKKPFTFASSEDYTTYLKNNNESVRVKLPKRDTPKITQGRNRVQVSEKGGSSIVLRRKEADSL